MPLNPGTRLGAYEIVAPLGAGGMGEVYRARDSRLGRDVAVKVLPELLAADPDALARFEREMQTLAALSHPHIVSIYDVGRHNQIAYAVTELLQGETLADITDRGALSVRKAIDYGAQIARALGAAHERGIVHRDLKPANVFVGSDGHVKVLDFGLARNAAAVNAGVTMSGTRPGMVMGTVGYMAPEQARGLAVDHRADIFSFGCVMYEMVSGRRAFQRDSNADTLSAILKEDPPPLSDIAASVPPALDRVVQRCLEKNPEERFQSARDLAFALEALSAPSGAPVSGPSIAAGPWTWRWRKVAAAIALLAGLAGAFVLGRAFAPGANATGLTITRLTFDRGMIRNARFASDGETVVYGAAWNGGPLKMFAARLDTRESKPMDLPDGDVLAVSRSGDLLISLARRYTGAWTPEGTLARGRLFSSSVREVLEHVRYADFLPDDRVAIVRRVDGRDRLEAPQGTVVFETSGYISHVRVAPDGRRLAFLEHPLFGDNRGYLAIYDGETARRVTPEYGGIEALAWSSDGREIWYSGASNDTHWKIRALDAGTRVAREGRTVWYVPRDLLVMDIDARGRVLLTGNDAGGAVAGAAVGDTRDRDLNWGRWTLPGGVSRDGRTMLLSSPDEFEPDYKVLTRSFDGAAPVQIGRGRAQELSPDGKWALAITPSQPHRVLLIPTGPGDPREVDVGDLDPNVATFVPRGLTVAVVGRRNGSAAGVVVDLSSGKRTALDLGALDGRAFGVRRYLPTHTSPDGSLVAVQADDGKVLAWSLDGPNRSRELAALADNEVFVGWSADRGRIYVAAWNGPRARIDALDFATGRRSAIREIAVADPSGMMMVPDLYLSADATSYIYGFSRMLSTLYVVSGLR
jgi:eukaryotic-like serine/threonine-protein kinase